MVALTWRPAVGDWRATQARVGGIGALTRRTTGGGLALTRRVVHIQVKPVHAQGGARRRQCTQKADCSHRRSLAN